jgi:hypothetical protein
MDERDDPKPVPFRLVHPGRVVERSAAQGGKHRPEPAREWGVPWLA